MLPIAANRRFTVLCLVIIAVLLTLSLVIVDQSLAATITVNADCTLVDAINAANTASRVRGCPPGSQGENTVVLTQDVILTGVQSTTSDGPNGLPPITSNITLLGNGFTVMRSDAANTPDFRIFQVNDGARLRLVDLMLRNGQIIGQRGRNGSNASRRGGDGDTGDMGSVGFVVSGAGGPGEDGGNGGSGRVGGAGTVARGGAIFNHGTLEIEQCVIADSSVRGGAGGTGGNGSAGGTGGDGGSPGIPIPLILFAILGPGGSGGDGGSGGPGGSGGDGGHAQGGAIYNDGGIVVIDSCTFENNEAVGGAGGIGGNGNRGGDAGSGGLSKDTLGPGGRGGQGGTGGTGGNGGNAQGAAIYNADGTVAITLSTVSNNLAQGGQSGRGGRGSTGADGGLEGGDGGLGGPGGAGGAAGHGQGGAIYSDSGDTTIERTTLTGNSVQGGTGGNGFNAGAAGDGGGPLMNWVSGLEAVTNEVVELVLDSILNEGSIGGLGGDGGSGGSGQGGTIFINSGTLTISRSTVANNVAVAGRGGRGGTGGLGGFPNELVRELELRGAGPGGNGHEGLAGNSQGGGTFVENTELEVLRSTFTDNQAGAGGGIWQRSTEAEAQVISSTIAGNIASSQGGGLDAMDSLSLDNSIVAENTAPAGADINGTIHSLDYNLIGDSHGVTLSGVTDRTLVDVSPNALALADNGGPTETMALESSSPAINRGRCSTNDQRGFFRIDDYCDIGAFEFGASAERPVPLPVILNGAPSDSIRAHLPDGVYGSVIASDGVFYRSAAEVGIQSLIDRGVIHAVDVFTLSDNDDFHLRFCLRGSGELIFLAASDAPRVPQRLPSTRREGYACVWVTAPGTIVQLEP